ncbi:MAG: Na+/H+ antiporter NhaA, partial [Actinomycetota bacterium]|nr:Na+/H+ antiporter NhaA [Actinomycetota bacterium]
MSTAAPAATYAARTAWARNLATPVRDFLGAETGSAAVVAAAAIVALLWANSPWSHSYQTVWSTDMAIRVGHAGISTDLRQWVNQGLMTLFFLVVGLEAKREMDLGEFRDRRRIAVPVLAAVGGMLAPIAIYLAFNAGGPGARDWGAAMSTDTAFALGALALLTPRAATRMRVFLLTLAVVDDLCGLVVIATVYTTHVSVPALAAAAGFLAVLLGLRYAPAWRRPLSVAAGLGLWVAMFKSGVDPVISGLAVGLATSAYPPSREDLERATALAYSFREQPTPELARSVQLGVESAISPNERLQYSLHPWTSYVIVPLFALANGGVHITGGLLGDAITSPITLGILFAYVVGKPVGITAASWIASRPMLHGPRPPVSGPILAAGGAVAGIGFTVSLLISSLAFHGQRLDEAKLGALGSVIIAPMVAWVLLRLVRKLPAATRARQLAATAEDILDLSMDIDPERDHIRGPEDVPVTLVEYGDFECTYCGQAEAAIRELLSSMGDDVRYVWRHLPLNDVHPNAQLASEASEAAAAQGRFWEMHDLLLDHQGELSLRDLAGYAEQLDLDRQRFLEELRRREYT